MASSYSPLFDPNYLPDHLLHRDHELQTLTDFFLPSDTGIQPLNLLVHGSFGIGRTTLVRYFGINECTTYSQPIISFQMKTPYEIVCDTLTVLTGIPANSGPLSDQWTLLKRVLRKSETPIFLTFDDIELTNINTYSKFLALCKECNVPSIATAPRFFPRLLSSDTNCYLDYSLALEPYGDQEFLDIIVQRVNVAFPSSLPASVTNFIADIIGFLDFQRPATAIELLRNLYPLIIKRTPLTAENIRQVSLKTRTLNYDFWSAHLSCLVDLDVSTVLLLQAIGEFFTYNPGMIYVSKPELLLQFQQICETSHLKLTEKHFTKSLNEVLFQDLLLCSRYDSKNYFTLLPAKGYLEIVDLILAEAVEC
jgi:hypothetical protein